MPLSSGTGKEAFSKNVKTEMAAGKLQKQAVAIAYAQQRKSKAGDCDVKSIMRRLHDCIGRM